MKIGVKVRKNVFGRVRRSITTKEIWDKFGEEPLFQQTIIKRSQMPLYEVFAALPPSMPKDQLAKRMTDLGRVVFGVNGVLMDIRSYGINTLGYEVAGTSGKHREVRTGNPEKNASACRPLPSLTAPSCTLPNPNPIGMVRILYFSGSFSRYPSGRHLNRGHFPPSYPLHT